MENKTKAVVFIDAALKLCNNAAKRSNRKTSSEPKPMDDIRTVLWKAHIMTEFHNNPYMTCLSSPYLRPVHKDEKYNNNYIVVHTNGL